MTFDASVKERLGKRLREIYGDQGSSNVLSRLLQLMQQHRDPRRPERSEYWDQRDVVLITYGDKIRGEAHAPLESLRRFLAGHGLDRLINIVHVLPFCPSTSDDGFSVVDYQAVDPALGSWDDIQRLGSHSNLVFDLVLNHVSQASSWFQSYLAGDPRYVDYFIETDPATDLSAVTRPRSSPLLTEYQTSRGPRHVWTTFSADQIDLNYANPAVLLDVLATLLFYIRQGARFVRLDAVAYIWKQVGTNCIHLPQSHGIVKLFRDVIDILAPRVILLTETNVPHAENISYFGNGDEAHMVYQFSLPPLLAEAMLHHDAEAFSHWLSSLGAASPGTTYFNFTASHDGIGVRPLEGLLSGERRTRLVEAAQARGGLVGTKRNADGTEAPYELNVTYFDLLYEPLGSNPARNAARFLASQAIMLSLRGIPGIYFHSLVGTHNDREAVHASGIPRRINRRKFDRAALDERLAIRRSLPRYVFDAYRRLLAIRIAQPAFHPDGGQQAFCVQRHLIAFLRTAPDASQRILVLANVERETIQVDLSLLTDLVPRRDLVTDTTAGKGSFELAPYQVAWLDVICDK